MATKSKSVNRLKRIAILVFCLLLVTSNRVAFAYSLPESTSIEPSVILPTAGSWGVVSSPTTNPLWTVDFSSPTSGWAGGDNILLRYDGSTWQSFSVPALVANFRVTSISMISDTDGWLVGYAQKINPFTTIVLHWDGLQWNEVVSPTSFALISISAVDATNVYTNGGGTLCSPTCNDLLGWAFLWNGSSWSSTPVGAHRRVTDVDMFGNSDGWMVGDEKNISTNQSHALAMRWVGGVWQSVSVPNVFNNRLYAVSTLDASHAWAIGIFDTLSWNGSAWNSVPNPTAHGLLDVLAVAPNDAWVVGEMGTILHWGGSSWTSVSSSTTNNLNSVAKVSPYDVWAVGSGGTILHFTQANVAVNHASGAAGSFFNLDASFFPPTQTATISVNGVFHQTTLTDAQGALDFTFSTTGIEDGLYVANITVGSTSAAVRFRIKTGKPVGRKRAHSQSMPF